MQDVSKKDYVVSVTEALNLVKSSLEEFILVIQGEVTDLKISSSYSAVYFSIKDEKSKLPCLIWKNRYAEMDFELKEGMLVNLTGKFSIYAKKGSMNFNVFNIEKAGEGQLRAKVDALIKKLDEAGILEDTNKKEIPAYPERIGVVTSGSGAVIHDILRTIRRRACGIEVNFWGVAVEGEDASAQMFEAIRSLDAENLDVILLARGGGSFEDMMPFNDEGLARAIYEAKTPIITGIGHEPDTTVADLVSDFRASTPTAAAEVVTQDLFELRQRLEDEAFCLSDTLSIKIESHKKELEHKKIMLDSLSPVSVLEQQKMRFDFNVSRLQKLSFELTKTYSDNVTYLIKRLEDLSPLSVLTRGYSYTKDSRGKVIKSIGGCDVGDEVSVVLKDGYLSCDVREKGVSSGKKG